MTYLIIHALTLEPNIKYFNTCLIKLFSSTNWYIFSNKMEISTWYQALIGWIHLWPRFQGWYIFPATSVLWWVQRKYTDFQFIQPFSSLKDRNDKLLAYLSWNQKSSICVFLLMTLCLFSEIYFYGLNHCLKWASIFTINKMLIPSTLQLRKSR